MEPIARPKAPACPPQMGVPLQEPVATKRQADDAPLQAPPNPFLAPEEQQPTGEQRPDPAKQARPPSPPGEVRARTDRDWLNFPAHERFRQPRNEDMEVIHWSAIPLHWQLPRIFPCWKTGCQPHCFNCACVANAQGVKDKLLAGEVTTSFLVVLD